MSKPTLISNLSRRMIARSQFPATCTSSQARMYASAGGAGGSSKNIEGSSGRKGKQVQSIMPAGTIMKDLSIHKDKPDPIALPDSEYPDWLWTLLDEPAGAGTVKADREGIAKDRGGRGGVDATGGGFNYKAERRKLRSNNKEEIKARNFLKST